MRSSAILADYLGVLAAGWCYVLSAWLVEVQGDGASMRYTDSRANVGSTTKVENASERTHSIDLGEEASADAKTVRWWSAILAKGDGWNAVVQEGHLDGDAFVTP
ncbi:hypothetical protein N8T08_008456 [Aspergillus melleus]|uniref:Uncharacterized protein n=1 Tax=Aspergillus melleus TaxID=138277 RepID=A0ACC3AVH1_9EURO|nr:hypothetical protein N8T08_008456 [Aspergillus melleus]